MVNSIEQLEAQAADLTLRREALTRKRDRGQGNGRPGQPMHCWSNADHRQHEALARMIARVEYRLELARNQAAAGKTPIARPGMQPYRPRLAPSAHFQDEDDGTYSVSALRTHDVGIARELATTRLAQMCAMPASLPTPSLAWLRPSRYEAGQYELVTYDKSGAVPAVVFVFDAA